MADPPPKISDAVRRCIMFHLMPAKRMTTFRNHPLLSQLHKEVPLRIGILKLAPTQIGLDSMKFTWGSVLLHLDGTPLHQVIIDLNTQGGCPFDVNVYGREIRDIPVTEGDLKIFGKYAPPFEGFGRKNKFDVFIRCAAEFENSPGYIVTVPNGKISRCIKEFTTNYLGANCHHVSQLIITEDPGVHRLPAGIQFKVHELFLPGNSLESIEVFSPVIHPSSFPLKVLLVTVTNPRDPILKNPVFKSAETIRLGMPENVAQQDWVQALLNMENPFVQLFENEICFKQLFFVVRDWIETPRPAGRKFALILEKVRKALFALLKVLKGTECSLPCRNTPGFQTAISFAVDEEVEVNCYGVHTPVVSMVREKYPYMMVMESMPRGSAIAHTTGV